MYSEIAPARASWAASTRANANRTTGLPNSYVLTPLADNYTRLPRRCRIRRLQECAKVERPHVGGHQDLPTGGHGDGTAVITESERIPCSQRCWVRAERRLGAGRDARVRRRFDAPIVQFWRRLLLAVLLGSVRIGYGSG